VLVNAISGARDAPQALPPVLPTFEDHVRREHDSPREAFHKALLDSSLPFHLPTWRPDQTDTDVSRRLLALIKFLAGQLE
jgi:hypothetical protein